MQQAKRGKAAGSLWWLSLLSLIVFLILWQLLMDLRILERLDVVRNATYILERPTKIAQLFVQKMTQAAPDGATLPDHFRTSFTLALTGYLAAVVVGAPLGLLMGWYRSLDGAVRPIFELVRPIPPIAWIPLSILLLGIGLPAKAFIIWLSAFVPSVINSYAGIKYTDPVLINVATTFGASRWETFRKVGVPWALPMVFTGLRLSLSSAWMTLVAAELLAATNGLGYMIQTGRRLSRPDVIIVGMLTIGFTGAVMALLLELLERRLTPWRKS
ncbi:MAG: ABC transporter permease [Chloroflexi bacterium]|nr:ABC transporter permease [Chloroflexota bacterium]